MKRNVESFYIKIIRKDEKGILSDCLRGLLWLASFPYRLAVSAKNFLYDKKILSSYMPPIPVVISIGNIVAGGTGKTPVTLLFAEQFYETFPLAILARGYRSEAEKRVTPIVLSRGSGPTYSAAFAGDEAYLMAERLPKAIVVVGRDRREASSIAAKLGATVALLDDAFQHRRLQRDKEVVVIDLNDPWGMGHFLPRGLLRESVEGLSRADLIVLNHARDNARFEEILSEVREFTDAPVIGTRLVVTGVYDTSGQEVPVGERKGALFCGIAHPDYFFNTVKSLGVDVVFEHFLSDHQAISTDTLKSFSETARSAGAEFLICTEKDKVKLPQLPEACLPIYWVKVTLDIVEGKTYFDEFVAEIKFRLSQF